MRVYNIYFFVARLSVYGSIVTLLDRCERSYVGFCTHQQLWAGRCQQKCVHTPRPCSSRPTPLTEACTLARSSPLPSQGYRLLLSPAAGLHSRHRLAQYAPKRHWPSLAKSTGSVCGYDSNKILKSVNYHRQKKALHPKDSVSLFLHCPIWWKNVFKVFNYHTKIGWTNHYNTMFLPLTTYTAYTFGKECVIWDFNMQTSSKSNKNTLLKEYSVKTMCQIVARSQAACPWDYR